jgi:MFS family permease
MAGRAADRFDKRRLLLFSQAGLAVHAGCFGLLLWLELLSVGMIYALVVAYGVLAAIDLPVQRAFWAELVPPSSLKSAVALNASALHGTRMLGPAIAGLLMSAGQDAAVFFVNAASYAVMVATLLRLPERRAPERRGHQLYELLQGMLRSGMRLQLGFVAVNSLCVFPYLVAFAPAFVRSELGGDELGLAALMGCSGAGALLGSLLVPRVPDRAAERLTAALIVVEAGALAGLALARSVTSALPLTLVLATALALGMSTALHRLQQLAESERRGAVMGLHVVVSAGLAPLAAAIWGVLAQYAGLRTMLTAMAACSIAGTAWLVVRAGRQPVRGASPAAMR